MKKILLDNNFETTLEDFLNENLQTDVEPLTENEISNLNSMSVGDIIYIGIVEVKRTE